MQLKKEEVVEKMENTKHSPEEATHPRFRENNHTGRLPVDSGYAWMVVSAVALMHILYGSILRSMGIISVELVDMYNTKKGRASIVVSGVMGVHFISSPLAAYFCRYFQHRHIAILGGLMCCLGFISIYFINDFLGTAIVFGILTGFGLTLFHCAAVATLAIYFNRYRGIAMGMLFSGSACGAFVGPSVIQHWCNHYGTRPGMILFGGFLLHICVFGAFLRPKSFYPDIVSSEDDEDDDNDDEDDPDHHPDPKKNPENSMQKLKPKKAPTSCRALFTLDHIFNLELLRMPDFWLISPAIALFAMSSPTFFFLIANYGRDLLLSPSQVTVVLIVQGAADIVCRASMGFVSDLRCVNRPLLATVFLFCHSLVWLMCTQIRTFPGLLCMSVSQALFGGSNYGIVAAVLSEVVSLRHISTAYAYCLFFEGVLNFIVPLITGALRDAMGNWMANFWIISIFNFISGCLFVVLLIRLHCTGRRKFQFISVQSQSPSKT